MTPEEFGDKLGRFARDLPGVLDKAAFKAAVQLNADISGRIFRVGGTRDTSGSTRPYESESWKAKRRAAGLQATVVDMTFTGDLQRSIKVVDAKNEASVKIVGRANVEKARKEDERRDVVVFAASDDEVKVAYDIIFDDVVELIEKYL